MCYKPVNSSSIPSIIVITVWDSNSGPLDLEVLNAQIVGPILRGYTGNELKWWGGQTTPHYTYVHVSWFIYPKCVPGSWHLNRSVRCVSQPLVVGSTPISCMWSNLALVTQWSEWGSYDNIYSCEVIFIYGREDFVCVIICLIMITCINIKQDSRYGRTSVPTFLLASH